MAGERLRGRLQRLAHGGVLAVSTGRQRLEAGEEVGDPLERLFGLRHRRPRELQLLAVVRAEVEIAQRRRTEAALDDVGEVEDVAERLRHLLGAVSSSSIMRCSTWTQKRENGLPVAPSLCAISFSWCGKIRSTPPA